jgi:5'-AMP-activated protein kinase catalytic alpha subunit
MIAQHQHGRRTRRWYLGIQSKKDPAHVMTEVYKALMALGCEWLQLSSYRIKCKWRPNAGRVSSLGVAHGGMPPAGGATPDAAFNRTMDTDSDVAMDDDKDKKRASAVSNGYMKVVAGGDGHSVPVPNLSTADYSIKIGLTLYKVQQNIYLLDFQKKTGDAFCFMTLCANIITELKTLSAASRQQQQQAMMAQQQASAVAQQQAMQQGGLPPPGMRD